MTQNIRRNYSYRDHVKFGWGKGTYNFDDITLGLPYWIKFGRCERQPMSFREECVNAARLIFESTDKTILVFFSGGIDSEVVVRSMMEAGVSFEVLIINFWYKGKSGLNSHDTAYALDFVKRHNIKYRIYDYDVASYIMTKYLQDSHNFRLNVLGFAVHADISRVFCHDYLCIFGSTIVALFRGRLMDNLTISEGIFTEGMITEHTTGIISPLNVVSNLGETMIYGFFQYTPELMLSWILNDDIQHWMKYEQAFLNISSRAIKPWVIHKLWDDIIPRPKYTSFEYFDIMQGTRDKWREYDPELVAAFESDEKFIRDGTRVIYTCDELVDMLSPTINK